jgi:hypothetical protein
MMTTINATVSLQEVQTPILLNEEEIMLVAGGGLWDDIVSVAKDLYHIGKDAVTLGKDAVKLGKDAAPYVAIALAALHGGHAAHA